MATLSKARQVSILSDTIVSVKDFGAVGNNVTDDTAAFQLAVAACESTQTKLYIPEGSYVLSSKITINNTFDIACDASAAIRWTNASDCGILFNFVDSSDTLCQIELPQLMSPAINSSFLIPGYSSAESWNYNLSSRVGSAVHLKGGNRIKLRVHYAVGWDAGVLVEPTNTATVDNIECDVGVLDFCVYGLKVINSGTASSKGLSQFGFTANTIWAKHPLYFDTSYGYIISSRFTVNGVYVNENGGCVVYGVGTNFNGNEIKIDWADAGLRADSVPATTANLRCPFLGGNQTSNGLSYDGMGTSPNIGYWGGKHCRIAIGTYADPFGTDLGSASPIPAAGHTIRIRDAGRFNSITVLNMADDTGNNPIATSAVGESNYNGGVGGAQYARAVYTSATLTSLGAGASTDQYIYHQLVSPANIRPINVVTRDEGALNNNIVVEAYPTQTTNREIRVRVKNNGAGSFTGSVYFWVVVGD